MAAQAIHSAKVGASVRETVLALEKVLTERSAQAVSFAGEEFSQTAERHETPNGFSHTYVVSGKVGGKEAFSRIVVEYDMRRDTGKVTSLDSSGDASISATASISAGLGGQAQVTVTGEVPAQYKAAFSGQMAGVLRSVERKVAGRSL